MRSATTHEKALLEQINKEIDLGRIVVFSFTEKQISNLRLNPVGVVPKGNGGRRLISHLSSPLGESVNDFIDPNLCSVSYSRFEDAIKKIQKLGKSTQLGIKDISGAFRLLPLYPGDF